MESAYHPRYKKYLVFAFVSLGLVIILQLQHLNQKLSFVDFREASVSSSHLVSSETVPVPAPVRVPAPAPKPAGQSAARENIYRERRERLAAVCRQYQVRPRHAPLGKLHHLFSLRQGAVYCSNGKTGTTTWMDHFSASLDMLPKDLREDWRKQNVVHGR